MEINSLQIGKLLLIILVAGILGGIANYFMGNESKTWSGYDFLKSLVLGIVAAATVPLFLATVSSGLMTEGDPQKYLIFGGFCLLASVFSAKFLQSLMDRVLKELEAVKKETRNNSETVDALVAQNSDDKGENIPMAQSMKAILGIKSTSLIDVLRQSQYTFRTLQGLKKDMVDIDEKNLKSELVRLETHGYVRQTKRSDGVVLWTLTPEGWGLS